MAQIFAPEASKKGRWGGKEEEGREGVRKENNDGKHNPLWILPFH